MGVRSLLRSTLFSAAIALSAVSARADDTNRIAAATLLFDEGVRALDAGRLEEACEKLAKSQELAPSGGTLLALAECHERAGRFASAWVAYRGAASRAAAAGKADAEAAALEQAARLEPQLARLTIKPAPGAANLEVSRDNGPVASSELGIAVPVDAGHHEIRVTAPGSKPWSKGIDVPPGQSITLDVPPLEPENVKPPPPPGGETSNDTGGTQRMLGLAAGGVGAAGLVVGSVFGILAMTTNSAGESKCNGPVCQQEGKDQILQANDFATVSTIAFIAGAVLAAGGAALYFTAPSQKKSAYLNPWTGTLHW